MWKDSAISVGEQVTDTANTAVLCCLTFIIEGGVRLQRYVKIKMDHGLPEVFPQMPWMKNHFLGVRADSKWISTSTHFRFFSVLVPYLRVCLHSAMLPQVPGYYIYTILLHVPSSCCRISKQWLIEMSWNPCDSLSRACAASPSQTSRAQAPSNCLPSHPGLLSRWC